MPSKTNLTYAASGVDIEAGNALVERIKPLAKSTRRLGADAALGGFGALFDLKPLGYKDPILVSSTDGVGTKLKVAIDYNKHDTVGIDLVAMSVNDLLVQGAEPLFFLDYFACSTLEVDVAADVISGIAEGCRQAGAALIGGETAEMPGMYAKGDYDLAGFAVGAVERDAILPKIDAIQAGDAIWGLASSGLHSNGFSLVRRVLELQKLKLQDKAPFDTSKPLGEVLLSPTKIYVNELKDLLKSGTLKALAHITGGGITENLPRVFPKHLGAEIDLAAWQRPALFRWLKEAGNIETEEALRTFNCGIGMIVVTANNVQIPNAVKIGSVTERKDRAVTYQNLDQF